MRKTNFSFTNISFVALAIGLLLLSLFSFKKNNEQAVAADWVTRSQVVKLNLTEALGVLLSAETAQRGYLLTRDSGLLNHLMGERDALIKKLAEISPIVSYNEEQIGNFKTARHYFEKRSDLLKLVLDSFHSVTPQGLDKLLLNGQRISDTLNDQVNLMKTVEDRLLAERLLKKQKDEKNASTFILLFSIFAIGILLFSFLRLKRESFKLRTSMYTNEILEQKVKERTAEIQDANALLENQNEVLIRQNDELNSFTFIATHDLKEPLRKIEMFCYKIMESDEDNISEKSKVNLNKLKESTSRMRSLLDAIFNYAQTGKDTTFETTDLNEIAALSVNSLQHQIDAKHALVEYDKLPKIDAIPLQMEQLFTNLIGNAVKYARKDVAPHIKIEAQQIGSSWKISFMDNGIGFDEAYSQKIFEMFQRLHNKSEYDGTGIGLAICKKIVQNHHGTIVATSTKGVGATFTIIFPANK